LAPGTLGWDTQSVFDETKSTHLYLVNRAAQLASTAQSPAGPFVAANLQPMQSPPQAGTFRQALCQGLRDADFLAPYNDPNRLGVATYASHFYDDTTGLNYEGEPEPTALTNGVKFFNLSVAAMRQAQPDPQAGGYNLGLALHYFTDLTQPMHSGNYTYLSSIPLGYHTQFEEYAMGVQATLVPQPTVVGFVPGGVNDPGQLYRAASQHFKATYLDQVIAAHKYFSWYWSPAQWQAAVLQLLPAIFNDSVQNTSQLVYLWATLVQAPHEDFAPEAAGVG
jgi:phospholipase C